jgi:hypothetical protein
MRSCAPPGAAATTVITNAIANAIINAQGGPAVRAGLPARFAAWFVQSFALEFALKLTVTSFAPPHGFVRAYYTGPFVAPLLFVFCTHAIGLLPTRSSTGLRRSVEFEREF